MMRIRTLMLGAALTLAAPLALGQSTTELGQAKTFYNVGAAAYAKGRYGEAAASFEDAYRIAPRPQILYSLALAEKKLFYSDGKKQPVLAKSIAHFEQYLRDAPTGNRREEATNSVAELTPLLQPPSGAPPAGPVGVGVGVGPTAPPVDASRAEIIVNVAADAAQVSLDNGPLTDAPLIVRNATPGRHHLRIVAEGYSDVNQDVLCEGGKKTALEVPLTEKPGLLVIESNRSADIYVDGRLEGYVPRASPIAVLPGAHVVALSSNGSPLFSTEVKVERGKTVKVQARLGMTTQRTVSFFTIGTGGAAVVVAGLLGLGALGEEKNAKDLVAKRDKQGLDPSELDAYSRALTNRDRAVSAMWISAGIGAGVLALGSALFIFDKPSVLGGPAPREAPEKTKRYDIDLAAAPWVSPQGAGAALGGTF